MSFLIAVGFLAIFSVTYKTALNENHSALFYLSKQFGSFIVGLIGMAFFAYLDYNHLKKVAIPLYIGMLLLLVFVLFQGTSAYGAQRWINLGILSFQPSEITKLVVIIVLATYFTKRQGKSNPLLTLFIMGLPFLLIFKQPDLGTALVVAAISFGMLIWDKSSPIILAMIVTPFLSLMCRPNILLWCFYIFMVWFFLYFSRVKLWDMLIILGLNIGVGVAFPIIWGLLKEYQRMRIIAFLNPGIDPYGMGYHTMQSVIAVGSGGFLGKGFLQGTQTQLHFIPEQHSDFIYSAITEEFGFVGAMMVLFVLFVLIRKAFIIAGEARDYLGGILVCGAAMMIFFHVFISIGMVLGIMPVVGIPLPFVSFGGTALIVNMILVGIIQSVAMRRRDLIF